MGAECLQQKILLNTTDWWNKLYFWPNVWRGKTTGCGHVKKFEGWKTTFLVRRWIGEWEYQLSPKKQRHMATIINNIVKKIKQYFRDLRPLHFLSEEGGRGKEIRTCCELEITSSSSLPPVADPHSRQNLSRLAFPPLRGRLKSPLLFSEQRCAASLVGALAAVQRTKNGKKPIRKR